MDAEADLRAAELLLEGAVAIRELTEALVQTSATLENALAQLERQQPIIDAAVDLMKDLNSVGKHFALHEAVENFVKTGPS